MAKITSLQSNVKLESMLEQGSQLLTQSAAGLNTDLVKNLVGMEGYRGESSQVERETKGTTLAEQLRVSMGTAVGTESLTPAQLEAGAIIMMASSSPIEYAKTAMGDNYNTLGFENLSDAPMTHDGMDFGYPALGMEYFNDTTLDKHMTASLVFNVQSARQDEFNESFFRTIAIDPSECGFMVEIQKTMVHRGVRHALNPKDSMPYNRRNILDAATDYTVLEDNSVKFVPYYREDGSNGSNFVPDTILTPKEVGIGSYFVRTSSLRVNGTTKNLLELSAHPGLVNSTYLDESDEFDGRFALSYIDVAVFKPTQTIADAAIVRFNTLNLARASFNKSQEGDGREMTLDFRGSSFPIDQHTLSVADAEIEALQEVKAGKWTLKLNVNAHATVNLQQGTEEFTVIKCTVAAVIDEDGNVRSPDDAEVVALLQTFKLEVIGYNYAATRSNSNRRNKGLLLDNVTERERYKIQLGTPLTSRKPTGRTDNTTMLNDLIVAARMRNNNQAITKLLGYTEQLEEVVKTITNEYDIVSIEGVGRHYIRPWCKVDRYNVPATVSALQTSDQPAQVREGILQRIRSQVATAYRESRMQPALEMLSGYTMSKPKVLIGTDVETANWLWIQGDVRTLGDQFEYKLVTTNDARFKGRIQWVFIVGNEGYSPLNFGNMLWVPELITDTNMIRNEGMANELTVQPRTYHVVNCPITGVVIPEDLALWIASKPAIGVETKTNLQAATPDNQLDGLTVG